MFLGVLDKTIIIGYLLHYDVVHFFFSLFYYSTPLFWSLHHQNTMKPPRYLLWEVQQHEGEHDLHLQQKQQ